MTSRGFSLSQAARAKRVLLQPRHGSGYLPASGAFPAVASVQFSQARPQALDKKTADTVLLNGFTYFIRKGAFISGRIIARHSNIIGTWGESLDGTACF